jgi:hypothetical protein
MNEVIERIRISFLSEIPDDAQYAGFIVGRLEFRLIFFL